MTTYAITFRYQGEHIRREIPLTAVTLRHACLAIREFVDLADPFEAYLHAIDHCHPDGPARYVVPAGPRDDTNWAAKRGQA